MTENINSRIERWLRMWSDGLIDTNDAAIFLEEIIADQGNIEAFDLCPSEIQDQIIKDALHFTATGKRIQIIRGPHKEIDFTNQMKKLNLILTQAGKIHS